MKNKQIKGFTLIEVLVALVVVAGGIAASTTLQGLFMHSASDAKNRTQATSLAQQKINDLKSFTEITKPFEADGETEIDWSASPEKVMAYEYIANDAGGIIASGVQDLASNTAYTLTWTSQDNWYTGDDDASAPTTTAPTPNRLSDFKAITVTVVWDDQTGVEQSVNLDSYISITPANGSAKVIGDDAGGAAGANGPEVIHNPGATPDVLPVFCSSGDCVETSRPLPDLVQTGGRENTIVTFEAVTYDDDNGNVALSQEESVTLSCNCTFDGNGSGNTPAYKIWSKESGEWGSHNATGGFMTKPVAIQDGNDSEAEGFCTSCCRDHHDGGGSDQTIFYSSVGSSGSDHNHYDASGSTVTSGAYIESCRLKRIDGIWRVFQDWDLKTITVLPRDSLAGVALQTAYIDYVTDFVQKKVIGSTEPSKPNTSDLRTPVELANGASRQLQSRGIYIDNVYSVDDDGVSDGIISSDYISYITATGTNTDYLNQIPFTEINLTLLSDWVSSDNAVFTVTNELIDTIPDATVDYYGVFSRGLLAGMSVSSAEEVTSAIEKGNNGITNTDNEVSTIISDTVATNIIASGGVVNLRGTFSITGYTLAGGGERLSVSISPADCSIVNGNEFNCSMVSPWTGSIELSAEVGKNNRTPRCTGVASQAFSGVSVDDSSIVLAVVTTCSY